MFTFLYVLNLLLMVFAAGEAVKNLFIKFREGSAPRVVLKMLLYLLIVIVFYSAMGLCNLAQAYPNRFYEAGYSMADIVALDTVSILCFAGTFLLKRVRQSKIDKLVERNQSTDNYKKWNQWLNSGKLISGEEKKRG